jgi:hypothetical protein
MMAIKYFIDESGHSGDLINSGKALDFDGQPIFSLACFGVSDGTLLDDAIVRLASKHRINSLELKSSSLKKKPGFTLDLVELICSESLPFFIEVVDKKFFLCVNIVNHHIVPPSAGIEQDYLTNFTCNRFAEYLYDHAPITVFEKFLAACSDPSELTLRESFRALMYLVERDRGESAEAEGIRMNLVESLDDYESMKQECDDAHLQFLPSPDKSKHSKLIWMLPNLSSLCNIYARINLFHDGALSDICMIHDEQKQFDEILEISKQSAESLLKSGASVYTPHSNYNFNQSAPLFFAESGRSSGIQIADVLAGFVMRYFKDSMVDAKSIRPQLHTAYEMLKTNSNATKGVGVNLVVPSKLAWV